MEILPAQKQHLASPNHKLVVTGRDPIPVEISHGMTIRREDLRNAHEEADVNIIHQMLSIVESSTNDINTSAISDDTDMFVLLVHFYHDKELTCHVSMEATSKERKTIDIQATVRLHKDIAGQLLAARALSLYDTVAQLWGIGKTRVVKVLKPGRQLSELWNSSASLADVVQESTAFIADVVQESTAFIADVVQESTAFIADVVQESTAFIADVVQESTAFIADVVQESTAFIADVVQESTASS